MGTKKSFITSAAIMSTYIYGAGIMAINPIIQKLIEAYPEISIPTIKMVSTLPSLVSSFVMILIGSVIGRKIKYKTVLIFAMICFMIGGMLPIVLNSSFYYILAARAIFGLGMSGISCRNALVIASCEERNRSKYLGYGIFVANGCGVLMQIITGYLADISLGYSYLVYLITIIPLVLIAGWLKEPENGVSAIKENAEQKEKIVIKPRVWIYIIIGLAWCILGYSIMTNMSTFIKMKSLGEASTSGSILSLYVLGGAVGGAISSRWYKRAQRFFVPMAFASASIGEALVLIGNSIPLIAIGTAMAGFGWFALNPYLMYFTSMVSGKASTPFATSVVLSATQVGVFLSSYWCDFLGRLTGDAIIATKYSAIIGFGLCAVLCLIYDIRPDALKKAAKKSGEAI